MIEESIFLSVNESDKLHIKRFYSNAQGIPLFLIHGSIENGKIFYSSSGKGLAPYLASLGFDVFAVDLRGRGKSTPHIDRHAAHGLRETIEEDIPAIAEKIRKIKGDVPQHWISHSWGGVCLLAYLARHEPEVSVGSMVFFATKRHISIRSLRRFWLIDMLWNTLGGYYVKRHGFLDAVKIRMGSDNESMRSFRETNDWVYQSGWLDGHDGFDYAAALRNKTLPPILSMTGAGDKVLGHPTDCQRLLDESGVGKAQFKVLSKLNGNLHDYDHINLLTHPDAARDHFPMVKDWILKHLNPCQST